MELEETRETRVKEVCQLREQLSTEMSEREKQREELEGQLRSVIMHRRDASTSHNTINADNLILAVHLI